MEEKKRDVEEYLKDLADIKEIMDQSEDSGIIEVWVFWVYGILVTVASVLSYLLMTGRDLSRMDVFLSVWLPVMFIAGVLETVGWVRKMDKKSIPLFSRRFMKVVSGLAGLVVIVSIMLYFLIQAEIPHAGIYLMAGAIPLFFYSQLTFSSIIIEAWILTGGGILFLINNVSSIQSSLFAGIIIGISYFILGFHMRYEEKKSNE